MIDLDENLRPWAGAEPWIHPLADWREDSAAAVGRRVASGFDMEVDWDPPDEEWVRLLSDRSTKAMVSTLFPIAIAIKGVDEALSRAAPGLAVVTVTDFQSEELRASPDLLRSTLLRFGWADDFDTEAFCAGDLFVESV